MSSDLEPHEFDTLLTAFLKEVRRIHVTWLVWGRMFVDTSAPHDQTVFARWSAAWGHLRYSVLCDLALSVVRLTDPPEMRAKGGSRPNLVVQRVLDEMESDSRPNLRCAAQNACRHFKNEVDAAGLKQFRNRVLAHNDLATAVGKDLADLDIEPLRMAVEWLVIFAWRCESIVEGRLVDWSMPGSAVNRSHELDVSIDHEVDHLIRQLKGDAT